MAVLIGLLTLVLAGVGAIIVATSRNRQAAVLDDRLSTFTERTLSLEEL